MFDFLSGLMNKGNAALGGVNMMQPGGLPSALEQFQGINNPNMLPQLGQGFDPAGAAMQAGPGGMPNVMQMPGAVTTPYPMIQGAQGPGMLPQEALAFQGGAMPDPAAAMGAPGLAGGIDPRLMMAAAGMMGGGQEEQQPRPAPGGGIHMARQMPAFQFMPGAQARGMGRRAY